MKNAIKTLALALIAFAALSGVASAQGQNSYTQTTLSTAMDERQTTMTVASNTGFAPATFAETGDALVRQLAVVDTELIEIYTTSGTTSASRVVRGVGGTNATPHATSSLVFVGAPSFFAQNEKSGRCTEANERVLPIFSVDRGRREMRLFNCVGGSWVAQTLPPPASSQAALAKVCVVPIGSVAYGSFGNDTTASTTGQFTASIYVPSTFLATGATALNGSVVDAASKKIFALYTLSGRLVANTATAGTLASGSDAFQSIAFTAPKIVTGPATYFISLQDDTADVAGVRTVAASTFNNVIASSITSVFGTLANPITAPSTFTANVGPIMCLN